MTMLAAPAVVTMPATLATEPTVTLAYLTDGETVTWTWHESVRRLEDHDRANRRHIRVVGSVRTSAGALGKARNRIAEGFLAHLERTDWLLMVDTDHGFRADMLDRLLDAADPDTAPVVAPLMLGIGLDVDDGFNGFRPQPRLVAYRWDRTGLIRHDQYPPDTLWRVDATGTGVLLIHRTVLEQVGPEWFTARRDNRGVELSEDLSFMLRLIDAGIPVHVHTGVPTTHVKPMWLSPADVPFMAEGVGRVVRDDTVEVPAGPQGPSA